MTVDPELPDAELRSVFGDSQIDRSHVAIERVYEPVASASSGIWRVAFGARTRHPETRRALGGGASELALG